jgi:hypothetical protein
LDRLEGGRLVVHDWFDWTGPAIVKLATQRRSKQLKRAAAAEARAAAASISNGVDTSTIKEGTRLTETAPRRGMKRIGLDGNELTRRSDDASRQQLGELEASLSTAAMAIAVGYVRAARQPNAVVASIRAQAPGGTEERAGVSWAVVGKALEDMAGAGAAFTPNALRAFVRGVGRNREAEGETGGGLADGLRQLAKGS